MSKLNIEPQHFQQEQAVTNCESTGQPCSLTKLRPNMLPNTLPACRHDMHKNLQLPKLKQIGWLACNIFHKQAQCPMTPAALFALQGPAKLLTLPQKPPELSRIPGVAKAHVHRAKPCQEPVKIAMVKAGMLTKEDFPIVIMPGASMHAQTRFARKCSVRVTDDRDGCH